MQLPKLTQLQSRFLASFVASAILILIYFSLTNPQFAIAADDGLEHMFSLDPPYELDIDEVGEDDFNSILRRAPAGVSTLANNSPQKSNIDAGQAQNWVVPLDVITGPHGETGPGLPQDNGTESLGGRQSGSNLYITLNTCIQPSSSNPSDGNVIPPQLEMYISQSQSNQNPGPFVSDPEQQTIMVSGGYAIASLTASDNVFIGISALNISDFSGTWNYEIAASIDAPFHSVNSTWSNLFFVDGDNHAALLITNDTTETNSSSPIYQEWMSITPPYGLFAHNIQDTSILGVGNSYCGLQNYAQIAANLPHVDNQNVAGMMNRGLGGKPKEQFYINSLNASSQYWGWLAMAGNTTFSGNGVVGGGGMVWKATNFSTKTDNNCALMYNLSFCSEVAYAVPSNPEKFSPTTGLPDLAALYDSNAAALYQFFNYSLQQIPCNTTATAQYSLARNCDDCASAYKQWLCAVTIPRCEDYSNNATWLMPRNTMQNFVNGSSIPNTPDNQAILNAVATNSSRNPIIDQNIQPGPYKEVLPCEDLCYDLVQSCPAALGFGCPRAGRGLEDSYGTRSNDSGILTCSYLGAAFYLSDAEAYRPHTGIALLVALLVVFGFA